MEILREYCIIAIFSVVCEVQKAISSWFLVVMSVILGAIEAEYYLL